MMTAVNSAALSYNDLSSQAFFKTNYINKIMINPTDDVNVAGVGLNLSTLNKYDWRRKLFVQKFFSGESFYLLDKTPVKLISLENKKQFYFLNKNHSFQFFVDKIKNLNGYLFCHTECGKRLNSSQLMKTVQFGGKPKDFALQIENQTLQQLRQNLKERICKSPRNSIHIKVGKEIYENIIDVETTLGVPKSDFHFINELGEKKIFISHKGGNKPNHFSQFSGINKYLNHEEIDGFIWTVMNETTGSLSPRQSFTREIKCETLMKSAVFGEHGSSHYHENNVQIFAQGDMSLEEVILEDDLYSITANNVIINNHSFFECDSYKPSLFCSYRSSSHNASTGLYNCRLGIYTRDFHKSATKI